MAQTENPFGPGMSDFGLVAQTNGDPLGSLSELNRLQSEMSSLQSVLQEPPPRANTALDAAIQGALAGMRGTLERPFTGEVAPGPEPTGFGAGLLTGLGAAVEGQQREALTEYMQRQRQAKDALDQREKISSGIRMVLAQNPMAFEALGSTDEGQRLLGMLAYGIDVPIDPTAKSRGAEETLARKQLMAFYNNVLRTATDPGVRAQAANSLQDMMDPDQRLSISPADMVRGSVPSYSEVNKLYGEPGVRALNEYRSSGDLDALMGTLSGLKQEDPDKMPPSQRAKIGLAQKIAQVKQDYRSVHGEDLSDVDAIKQLPDEDRILAENMFRNIADEKDVPLNRYVAELERAWDDQPIESRESDPAQAMVDAQNMAWHRINAARKMQQRVKKAESKPKPSAAPPSASMTPENQWRKMVVDRARSGGTSISESERGLVAEYLRTGREDQVPASARRRTGM